MLIPPADPFVDVGRLIVLQEAAASQLSRSILSWAVVPGCRVAQQLTQSAFVLHRLQSASCVGEAHVPARR
jgi:hypothetical protein